MVLEQISSPENDQTLDRSDPCAYIWRPSRSYRSKIPIQQWRNLCSAAGPRHGGTHSLRGNASQGAARKCPLSSKDSSSSLRDECGAVELGKRVLVLHALPFAALAFQWPHRDPSTCALWTPC